MITRKLLNKEKLLESLNSLNYSERIKTMALIGRDYKKDKEYERLLLSLISADSTSTSSEYEAELALTAACVSRDITVVLKGLHHDSSRVKYRAAGILGKIGGLKHIKDEIGNLSYDCRRRILKTISVNNRTEIAEGLLPMIYEEYGDKEAVILLSACSYEVVGKYIDKIGYVISNWNALAARNRKAVEEYFEDSLKNSKEQERIYVWYRFSTALEEIILKNPEFILKCIIKYGPSNAIFTVLKKYIGFLYRKNPNKVYDILMDEESRESLMRCGIPKAILKSKNHFTNKQWIEIGSLLKDTFYVIDIFHELSMLSSKEIFEGIYKKDGQKNKIIPLDLLYELPSHIRDKEAKRMLKIREVYENKDREIRIAACQNIDDAKEFLYNGVKSSNVDIRALYYKEIVRNSILSRKNISETIEFLKKIKNDQDLVKNEVFHILSKCPPSLLINENIKGLSEIFDSVIDARDSSYETLSYSLKFACRLMEYNIQRNDELFDFSINKILKIIEKNQYIKIPLLVNNIPKGLEEKIFDRFYNYALNSDKRENYEFIIKLAGSFGKRGQNIQKLQELLKHVVINGNESQSQRALSYYLAFKKTRHIRVADLLKIDKSFITIDSVFEHVHRNHQELLDSFITWKKFKGKFLTGKTVYLIPAQKDFYRWVPYQQKYFASILEEAATNSQYDVYMRINAIKALGQMTIKENEEIIIKLLDDENTNIAEAAIFSLSTIDNPEKGAEHLIKYLDDDKARVAMYSLRKCFNRMKPSEVSDMIGKLLHKSKLKITVKKEIIRLLGVYKSENSLEILIDNFQKANVHKDVIIAIGHSIRNFLYDERAWSILSSISSSEIPDIALSILNRSPLELPEKYRERYLSFIIKAAKHKDSEVASMAYVYMKNWSYVNEKLIGESCVHSIIDMKNCRTWKQALNTLILLCNDGSADEFIVHVFKKLEHMCLVEEEKEDDFIIERDMPARQRLISISNRLLSLPFLTRIKLNNMFQKVISILCPHITMTYLQARFYIASIDWRNSSNIIWVFDNIGKLLQNRLFFINDLCKCIKETIDNSKKYFNCEILFEVSKELLHKSLELQFVGLTLLEIYGEEVKWNENALMLLRQYRCSNYIEIKSKSLNIWTIKE